MHAHTLEGGRPIAIGQLDELGRLGQGLKSELGSYRCGKLAIGEAHFKFPVGGAAGAVRETAHSTSRDESPGWWCRLFLVLPAPLLWCALPRTLLPGRFLSSWEKALYIASLAAMAGLADDLRAGLGWAALGGPLAGWLQDTAERCTPPAASPPSCSSSCASLAAAAPGAERSPGIDAILLPRGLMVLARAPLPPGACTKEVRRVLPLGATWLPLRLKGGLALALPLRLARSGLEVPEVRLGRELAGSELCAVVKLAVPLAERKAGMRSYRREEGKRDGGVVTRGTSPCHREALQLQKSHR